jgi:choline dehydrogenase-like flavoprotein
MDQSKNSFPRTIDSKKAAEGNYDVIIIGAGIAGSILAHELGKKKKRVLIIEAGAGNDFSPAGFRAYLETFYSAVSKDNQAPFNVNPNAPVPRSPDVKALRPGEPNTDAYWVQNGPFVSDSTYSRLIGGTTIHWEAKAIRMLPEDFRMLDIHKVGLNWPIEYKDLEPYYRMAEREIGVSGDVASQKRLGAEFSENYVYPMHEMPPSYLDQVVDKGLSGMKVKLDGTDYDINLATFPQGRNGIPNKEYKPWNYDPTKDYQPVGSVSLHQEDQGERCQGNTNCVPICPVQAKYDARKTLVKALNEKCNGEYCVDLLCQAVASQVIVDPGSSKVKEIEIKVYKDPNDPDHDTVNVKGHVFILATNAVENARLMLASGLPGTSKLIGKNLMDHPYLLNWALLPESAGLFNGPVVTSGICNLRRGSFRRYQAAFAADIHNDGWGWATGSPVSDLVNCVDNLNKFGTGLRNQMFNQISRQLLLAYMIEMLPEESNRVTVDPRFRDALGNLRPVVSYNIPDYSMKAAEYARQLSKQIFQRLGAEDHTAYDLLDYGHVNYNGDGYSIRGGNHLSGTHIMGTNKTNSVVNSHQKSWDHTNLYLVGAGSMPTIGTSNTTLTLSALCFRTAEAVYNDLK